MLQIEFIVFIMADQDIKLPYNFEISTLAHSLLEFNLSSIRQNP